METAARYLVNIKIGNDSREDAFFRALQEIDRHPLTIADKTAYAIKSKLGGSEIFAMLSGSLAIEDTLLIVPIKDKYDAQSPEFIHWINFRD